MEQNKTGKYLKYAIGEIALVVIGILIALSINNWNEDNKNEKIELQLLTSVRNDVSADIEYLEAQDSIFSKIKSNAETVITLFYKARLAEDFSDIIALNFELWSNLEMNKSAYNEMLNTGNFYNIKNKGLKKIVSKYYLEVDKFQVYVSKTNDMQVTLSSRSDLFPYNSLVRKYYYKTQTELKDINTSWINNPKSITYMALREYFQSNLHNNLRVKLWAIQDLLIISKQLKVELTKELEKRKQN